MSEANRCECGHLDQTHNNGNGFCCLHSCKCEKYKLSDGSTEGRERLVDAYRDAVRSNMSNPTRYNREAEGEARAALLATTQGQTSEAGGGMAEIMLRGANAMIEAIERVIPRNDADRDYADTVRLHVESQAQFLNAAEQRILDLEDEIKGMQAKGAGSDTREANGQRYAIHKETLGYWAVVVADGPKHGESVAECPSEDVAEMICHLLNVDADQLSKAPKANAREARDIFDKWLSDYTKSCYPGRPGTVPWDRVLDLRTSMGFLPAPDAPQAGDRDAKEHRITPDLSCTFHPSKTFVPGTPPDPTPAPTDQETGKPQARTCECVVPSGYMEEKTCRKCGLPTTPTKDER